MTDPKEALTHDMKRRSVLKAAAWTAPVVAAASVVPLAAASGEPPQAATTIGATATSPHVNGVGRIVAFGTDDNGNDGLLPNGQSFTLSSSDLDFDKIITSITGGSIAPSGTGSWLITPNSGSTAVTILFKSPDAGSYTLTNNGPVQGGPTWSGTVNATVA